MLSNSHRNPILRPPALCKTLAALSALIVLSFFAASRAEAGNCAGCSEFRTDRDSSGVWLRDGDPREGSKTQKRGTVTDMSWGTNLFASDDRHPIFLDTLVFTGDTNNAGNGVPAGSLIKACTLWITMQSLPAVSGPDSRHIYDLYEVTESWNEDDVNAVSWNNRTNGVAWTTAGISGTKLQDSALFMERYAIDTFVWKVHDGTSLNLWDTVTIPSGDTIPIPLPLSAAQNMFSGAAYGIALKWRSDGESSFYKSASSEHATATSRPQFQWVYQAPASALPTRRRRIIQQIGAQEQTAPEYMERLAQ